MTPVDWVGALPPEDNCWIRCWAAANACSAEPCRCLACTASFSRLTNLASNSSVVDVMYCRGSILKSQELRYHVRSEDSEGTANRACNTGRDNKRGQVQHMDDAQTLCVLRSQPIPQPTRCMSRLPQATCWATPEETWLEQNFRATDRHSNSYSVTTCSLRADIRFWSRPMLCTRYTTRVTRNIKHVLPAWQGNIEYTRVRTEALANTVRSKSPSLSHLTSTKKKEERQEWAQQGLVGLCLSHDLSPAARAAWLTSEEARPEDAGRLSVRVCFGLQLWEPKVVKMWLRHAVAMWSRHMAAKWPPKSLRISCKKVIISLDQDRWVLEKSPIRWNARSYLLSGETLLHRICAPRIHCSARHGQPRTEKRPKTAILPDAVFCCLFELLPEIYRRFSDMKSNSKPLFSLFLSRSPVPKALILRWKSLNQRNTRNCCTKNSFFF